MVLTLEEIKRTVSRVIANDAKEKVRRFTPSRTLKDALRVTFEGGRWWIGVPHYWAVFYHDGRGPVRSSRPGGFLVWYKNPKDDPRHGGDFPVRKSQIRSLRQSGISLERLRADIESGRAVIARTSPRSGESVAGKPFFIRGLRSYFAQGGNARSQDAFNALVHRDMPDAFRLSVIKQLVRV